MPRPRFVPPRPTTEDDDAAKEKKKSKKKKKKKDNQEERGELVDGEDGSSPAEEKDEGEDKDKEEEDRQEKEGASPRKGKSRKHPTIQEQLDDLDDLNQPIPEQQDDEDATLAKAKKIKKNKEAAGTIGMQVTRQRTIGKINLGQEKDKKDKDKKKKKKKDKQQVGTAKLADGSSGSETIHLTDDQCSKLSDIGSLLCDVKLALNQQTDKIDEYEGILGQVEDAVDNLQKMCSLCQLIWRIDDFKEKFNEALRGEKTALYSPSFRTHPYGYQVAVSLCPNGDGKGKGQFMSIFFCLLQGDNDTLLEWPFEARLSFTLLDQSEAHQVADIVAEFIPFPCKSNLPFLGRPTKARNPSLGLPRFVAHSDLWGGDYVKDDTIFIRVEVDVSGVSSV